METGRGVGGPLHSVKITGSAGGWDGRIEIHKGTNGGVIKTYHPGRYRWNADFHVWDWVPSDEPPSRDARPGGHSGYNRKPPS